MTASRSTPPLTPTVQPRASPKIVFHGREIFRVMGFVTKLPLRCPDGHAVTEQSVILTDGIVTCYHRPVQGAAQCLAMIYLLVFPARGPEKRRLWAAHITKEEYRELERLELDADGVLAYFGATFTI
jgi:hypothetical protein